MTNTEWIGVGCVGVALLTLIKSGFSFLVLGPPHDLQVTFEKELGAAAVTAILGWIAWWASTIGALGDIHPRWFPLVCSLLQP